MEHLKEKVIFEPLMLDVFAMFLVYLIWNLLDLKPGHFSRYFLTVKKVGMRLFYHSPVVLRPKQTRKLTREDIFVVLYAVGVLFLNLAMLIVWLVVMLATDTSKPYAAITMAIFGWFLWFINRKCFRDVVRHFRPDLSDRF